MGQKNYPLLSTVISRLSFTSLSYLSCLASSSCWNDLKATITGDNALTSYPSLLWLWGKLSCSLFLNPPSPSLLFMASQPTASRDSVSWTWWSAWDGLGEEPARPSDMSQEQSWKSLSACALPSSVQVILRIFLLMLGTVEQRKDSG